MKVDTTASPAPPSRPSRVPGVTTQIFIGLALGIVIGYVWPWLGKDIKPLADAFLKMIKMIIAPLLFSTLVVGIAGTGDMKAMGRIGLKAIIYFEVATTIALFWGLALVNWFQPGAGVAMTVGDEHGRPGGAGDEATGSLGHLPAPVPDVRRRRDGQERHPAARRVLDVLRDCRGGHRREGQAGHRRAREHRAGDVQVHGLRDEVRAGGRHGGHRATPSATRASASSTPSASSSC